MSTITLTLQGEPYEVRIELNEYARGGLAVELITVEDGSSFAVLSCWFPETALLPPDAFYLKDWSENAPIAEQLREKGLLIPFPDAPRVRSGFVEAGAVKLNEQALGDTDPSRN